MLQHATAVVAFTVLLCLSACSGKKDRGGGDTGQDADAPSDTTETTDPDVGEPDVPLDDPLDPDQPMDGREEPDAVETDVAEEDATEDPETEELTCVAPYPALSDVRVTISDSESSTDPCLAWTGSEFGVSWVDSRDGTFEIYFARISSAGSKIGTDERVTSYSSPSGNPTLTWTGSEFGVSWQNEDLDFEIYFARISASGSKVGTDLRVTSDAARSETPSLAWTGSEFGVSWVDSRDGNPEIYFARISSSGTKVGTDVRVTDDSTVSYNPSLAWTGSEFGVGWVDPWDAAWDEISFARISSSGSKVGTDVRVTNAPEPSWTPSLAWTGSEFGVSWVDSRDGNYEIYFARISSSGSKVGTDVRVTNDTAYSFLPSLTWTGSEFGVSWQDDRDGNHEIYLARISSSGSKVGTDVRVTNAPEWSSSPSLTWTGSEFGVSWQDDRDTPACFEIFFNLIRVCP